MSDLKLLGIEFPSAIFDVSMLLLIFWYAYSYLVKWTGDLMSFRLWYSESSVWSNFGTKMKLDKTFISGGIAALQAYHELQEAGMSEEVFAALPPDKKNLYEEFKLNAKLYGERLGVAGQKFRAISAFGHFYVWFQGFVLPIGAALVAFYLLMKYGAFIAPPQF